MKIALATDGTFIFLTKVQLMLLHNKLLQLIFVFLTLLVGSVDAHNDVFFETLGKTAFITKDIKPEFGEKYLEEIQCIHRHSNPNIDPSIDTVYVMAGRWSYLINDVDGLNSEDQKDDFNRIRLGINVARQIVAQRAKKNVDTITETDIQDLGPKIIYNGRPGHNTDLRKALNEGILKDYPQDKFLILDLASKEEWNSKGQMISLKRDAKFVEYSKAVAVVTHAYHGPRVLRLMGEKWYPFGIETKVYFHLVDRELIAPGVEDEILGEMKRIPVYVEKGDLAKDIPTQIHY